ncbi:SDR family oxidoreductase [Streptomyces sp. NPDC021096]|uniref:SDR family oxidoreductase n=1 Tax=Streptomyces sp. NPDC021096 TaxID=3154792 RepID=UPI0034012338
MTVALVTGCSSGIGMHSALAFARQGTLTYASMRDTAKATPLLETAREEGLPLEVLRLDVRQEASVTAAVRAVEERHGAVGILVNNAGLSHAGPVETIAAQRAEEVMDTNYWGAVRMARAVLPGMRARGHGVIVNVGSMAGLVPGIPYNAFYMASKHALSVTSECLAMEVGPLGIRVVCVEPDYVPTQIFAGRWQESVDPHGPYAQDHAWAERYMRATCDDAGGGHPGAVADVVVRAALDPKSPLHVPVGETCEQVTGLARQCRTFEEWSLAATHLMESAAGPRPARP